MPCCIQMLVGCTSDQAARQLPHHCRIQSTSPARCPRNASYYTHDHYAMPASQEPSAQSTNSMPRGKAPCQVHPRHAVPHVSDITAHALGY